VLLLFLFTSVYPVPACEHSLWRWRVNVACEQWFDQWPISLLHSICCTSVTHL